MWEKHFIKYIRQFEIKKTNKHFLTKRKIKCYFQWKLISIIAIVVRVKAQNLVNFLIHVNAYNSKMDIY